VILRDAVHGLVSFEANEESVIPRLMDTPELQRLRRIRQLGVASYAFPGAEHTRFAHALRT
jgi:HD superfamily phosphohydrolase